MKKFMVAATLFVLSISQANAIVKSPDGKFLKSDAVAGKALSATCAACHGSDGNSTDPQYPRLAGQNASYIYKQLSDFKSGKRNNAIMAPFAASLTPQQMYDVAGYFASQQSSVSMADGGILAKGEKLYRGGDAKRGVIPCSGCHGPAGKGNDYAVFPKLGGQHAGYIEAQLKAFRAAGRADDVADSQKRVNDAAKAGEQGMMQMVAASLSDDDIKVLANFLSGLHDK